MIRNIKFGFWTGLDLVLICPGAPILDMLQSRRLPNHVLQSTTDHLKWGLEQEQQPHLGDEIMLFNQSWLSIPKISVIECWIKSECLDSMHAMHLNSMLTSDSDNWTISIDLALDDSVSNLANRKAIGPKDLGIFGRAHNTAQLFS